MASLNDLRAVAATLTGTTADTITLNQLWGAVEVSNVSGDDPIYVRTDGTAATSGGEGQTIILPGQSKLLRPSPTAPGYTTIVLSLVGDGNAYAVEGTN